MNVACLKSCGQLIDFLLKMADLHDSHVLSTCFMKSDWLKMKYPDVGVKCKQNHVVKCSVDHQKMLSRSSPKINPHGYSCGMHAYLVT